MNSYILIFKWFHLFFVSIYISYFVIGRVSGRTHFLLKSSQSSVIWAFSIFISEGRHSIGLLKLMILIRSEKLAHITRYS